MATIENIKEMLNDACKMTEDLKKMTENLLKMEEAAIPKGKEGIVDISETDSCNGKPDVWRY